MTDTRWTTDAKIEEMAATTKDSGRDELVALLTQARDAIATCHLDPNNRMQFDWYKMQMASDALNAKLQQMTHVVADPSKTYVADDQSVGLVKYVAPIALTEVKGSLLRSIANIRTVCNMDDREMIFRDAVVSAITLTNPITSERLSW